MKIFLYISYILTLLLGCTYISFAQMSGDFPMPPKAWEFCTGQKCDPLPPPPAWIKGMIFRFLWPKKNNIDKSINQLQKFIPRLEQDWVDTQPIKDSISKIIVNDESSEQLLLLWFATKDKNIKKTIWDKVFVMHTQIVQEFKNIRQYISSKIWPKKDQD